MLNIFKKNSGYFILSKGIFHISLDGPLDEKTFQQRAKEKHYPLFALALAPGSDTWLPLRDNSWGFPVTPNEWVEERFPKLSLLCAGKDLGDPDFYLQFSGSKLGPVTASGAMQADSNYFFLYELLLRATNWKDWLLIEDRDWLQRLLEKGVVQSREAETIKEISDRESHSKRELRTADRHTVIATMWRINTAGEKKLLGACVDLSITGAQILLDKAMDLKVGDVLDLSVRPSKIASNEKLDIYVDLKGKLIWYNPRMLRLGIQFVDLTPNTKSKLELLVEHYV